MLVVAVVVLACVVLAAARLLVLAALFAVLFGGTFLPVADWLERHHVKRSLAALIVVVGLVLPPGELKLGGGYTHLGHEVSAHSNSPSLKRRMKSLMSPYMGF